MKKRRNKAHMEGETTMKVETPLVVFAKPSDGPCKDKCCCSTCGLDYHDPDSLVSSQWGSPSVGYVIYRVLVAVFFFAFMVISMVAFWPADGLRNHRFFSAWNYDLLTLNSVMRAILAVIAYSRKKHGAKKAFGQMSSILKVTWVFNNITSCSALVLTFTYWAFIFQWSAIGDVSTLLIVVDIQRHIGQALLVIADIFITATPMKFGHIYHGYIFGMTFILFAFTYNFLVPGNSAIYPFMDWKNNFKNSTLYSFVIAFGLTSISWLFLYGLSKLKRKTLCSRNIDTKPVIDLVNRTKTKPLNFDFLHVKHS